MENEGESLDVTNVADKTAKSTSNWKPFSVRDWSGDDLNVPNGDVTNSINNSGPDDVARGSPFAPPPQNFSTTGSRVV